MVPACPSPCVWRVMHACALLGFACQPCSANPDWWLVVFPSCGVGLWCIKGTLRFWHSLPLWLFGLMLQPCPRVTLLGGWWAPQLTPLPFSFKASELGTVWNRRLQLSASERAPLTRRSLVLPFIVLLLEAPFFISVCCSWFPLFFFGSERCVCFALSVSPQCFLWLRHWGHGVQRWVGFRVQRSAPSFLSTSTRRPFHSSLPDFMRPAPCMGISSIHRAIQVDPICSLVP